MATIINNPTSPQEPTIVSTTTDSSGWVVAVVILLIVIVGAAIWYTRHRGATVVQQPGATVNVTLPTGANQPAQ
jgi:hypothetical protein